VSFQELKTGTALAQKAGMSPQSAYWLVAAFAAVNLAACGPSWPNVRGVGDPAFLANQSSVSTVDMLPVDLQVWTYSGSKDDPTWLAQTLASKVEAHVHTQLAMRGYGVGVTMDWHGQSSLPSGGTEEIMPEEAVVQTAYSLSSYGIAQERAGAGVLSPHLPAKLGPTGSEATLYVGGWAYAGKKRSSTGSKVAKGIVIGLLVVGAVVLIAAALGGKGGGKGKGGSKGGGGGGGALAKMGRVVGSGAKLVARTGTGLVRSTGSVGRVAGDVISASARGAMRAGVVVSRNGARIAVDTADAFARSGTHFEVYYQRPDYYSHRELPRKGYSKMMLEMTLVDNNRGQVLWHARETFPADPRNNKHVERAVKGMLASLPAVAGGRL
jgi:hypothetical protein